ncbi:hypothetical protein [Gulosibacter sp. 10]|uniref:hypothetical protein n=1 Tax=Gulosibacter sp. 10 TaxID=1255570 RepID=UPI00097EC6A6|nr:hypothetical protein [Gulosibacter sp. 10]SJM62716.1 hypothetical protein FM112_08710 [Gulosibacter sp. 10]
MALEYPACFIRTALQRAAALRARRDDRSLYEATQLVAEALRMPVEEVRRWALIAEERERPEGR